MKTAAEIRDNLTNIAKAHEAEQDMKAEEIVHRITEEFFSSGEECYVISRKDYPVMSTLSNKVLTKLTHLGFKVDYFAFGDEWIVAV